MSQTEHKLPVWLWAPNLMGYLRWATLGAAMLASDPASSFAVWMVMLSLILDFFDGPCARYLQMCSQFGDLLDHYCDHAAMLWLVWVTASSGPWGKINLAISFIHNVVAFIYMATRGHYFKHSKRGNLVTRTIESNNYWNMASILYCANCMILPVLKLSFAGTHGLKIAEATTPLVEIVDMLGAAVTLAYTVCVWF